MSLFRFQIWHLAVVIAILCPSTSYAWQGGSDLLDPTLDRPLAQYESTADVGFETALSTQPPKAVTSAPKPRPTPRATPAPAQPLTQPQPTRSRPAEDPATGGTELAPNPLANPGSIRSTQPKKIDVGTSPWNPPKAEPASKPPVKSTTKRPQPQPKKAAPTSKPPKRSLRSVKEKAASSNSTNKAKGKKKTPRVAHAPPELTYNIYRDASMYPLDPRKPNNPCTKGPSCGCGHCGSQKTGLHGRPYQPHEPGGYRCGKNCPNKRPEFSIYWPRPFSVKREDHRSECGCSECCGHRKINDLFDGLSNFRLIDYHRTDNGYSGPECDPYGCLGESKVVGLGFRSQGAPVAPSSAYPLQHQ